MGTSIRPARKFAQSFQKKSSVANSTEALPPLEDSVELVVACSNSISELKTMFSVNR